jgi:glycosyltransferase involved in cell wall biosynthesis
MLLSIIVPLYNDHENLQRFIGFIEFNKLGNTVEFLFVDDGSIESYDAILTLVDTSNVSLFTQTNGKQGKARNTGVKNAKGLCVWFVDVDDKITNQDIDFVLDKIKDGIDKDVLFFDAICNGKSLRSNFDSISREKILHLLAFNKISVAAWNKIYNRDFLLKNNIRFIENRKFEDLYFAVLTCWFMKSWTYNPTSIYTYFVNQNSTTNTFNIQILDIFYVLKDLKAFLFTINKRLYLKIAYVHGLKYTLIRLSKSRNIRLAKSVFNHSIVKEILQDFSFTTNMRFIPVVYFYYTCSFFLFKNKE